jgi:gamma-glutamyltranspeptidase/glutathione hydrolase
VSPFLALPVLLAAASLPDEQVNARAARGARFMVVAEHPEAARVGLRVLREGGNAVDAAVATAFALAVVYPQAGNLGGGGFLVARLADGSAFSFDFRERAPLAAHRDLYLDEKGEVRREAILYGPLAAGVPGSVAGLCLVRERLGSMPLARLLAPAIELAEKGFPVDPHLSDDLARHSRNLERFPEAARIFLREGKAPLPGERLLQPDLAWVLRAIAERGPKGFYEGEVAQRLVEGVRDAGGIWTLEDVAGYRSFEREPLRGTYRGYGIVTMGPPSGGGVTLLQSLRVLEAFDLAKAGFGSSRSIHLLAETFRRAFADRARYLGDPDFVDVPLARLLSKERADSMRAEIDLEKASPSPAAPAGGTRGQTTHLGVVDGAGNAVSLTTTINDFFGCHFVAPGTGFFLNNEMDDFSAKPGAANLYGLSGGEANAIAPGKRPLSSMTPTIVSHGSALRYVLGSPGGGRIPTSVLEVLVNLVDHGMGISEAVRAPRIHHQGGALEGERFAIPPDVRRALEAMGHRVEDRDWFCSVQAIEVRPDGTRLGYSDPRRGGLASGD